MTSRLSAALRRRFASPAAALAALGLPVSLLEGTDMSLSRTAALAAVAALRRRGLIAQDGHNDQEAAEMIEREAGGEDRTRRARDMRRTRDGMTEEERRHPDAARDALRRAGDAAEIDDETIGELLEALCETHPEVVGRMAREVGQDGPRRYARDRRDLRRARDARMLNARPRRMGADDPPPFRGMPETGGGMVRDDERGEGYRTDRSWEELGHGTPTGEDRGRRRAFDIAMDRGDSHSAVEAWLGPQAASINRM